MLTVIKNTDVNCLFTDVNCLRIELDVDIGSCVHGLFISSSRNINNVMLEVVK